MLSPLQQAQTSIETKLINSLKWPTEAQYALLRHREHGGLTIEYYSDDDSQVGSDHLQADFPALACDDAYSELMRLLCRNSAQLALTVAGSSYSPEFDKWLDRWIDCYALTIVNEA